MSIGRFFSGFFNIAGGGGGLTDGDKGDIVVASDGASLLVDTNVITNAKLAQAPAVTIKGNITTSTANVTDISLSDLELNFASLDPISNYITSVTPKAVNIPAIYLDNSMNLTNSTFWLYPIYLPAAASITGVLLGKNNRASYTGNNENSVSLYTESGGTLTRVALGTGLEAVLENATLGPVQVAFSAPYSASARIYWVGVLANWSATVTNPALISRSAPTNMQSNNKSAARSIAAQGSAPSSLALSTTNAGNSRIWVGLY
jgi:hypothetical protein